MLFASQICSESTNASASSSGTRSNTNSVLVGVQRVLDEIARHVHVLVLVRISRRQVQPADPRQRPAMPRLLAQLTQRRRFR